MPVSLRESGSHRVTSYLVEWVQLFLCKEEAKEAAASAERGEAKRDERQTGGAKLES